MSLRVAVQMDPLEKINISGDSTFALMLSAQQRGHQLYHYLAEDLTWQDERLYAGAHVVPEGTGPDALAKMVARLLAKPAEALRITRGLLHKGARDEIYARMKLESSLFAERLASDEVKQAISAFFAARAKA